MFLLQESPIDIVQLKNYRTHSTYGALVSFEGVVRNDTKNDSQVDFLLYLADHSACIQEGKKVLEEAFKLFAISHAVCIQRVGKVPAGEAAIWIGVWSLHRHEAFEACQYIIEEIKKRLRIWKKEFLTNGSSLWVYGAQTPVIQ